MYLDDIRDMTPVERYCYFIMERENIRLKRACGDAKPWTDDPILREYRFCNVRRMDDKVSDWLLKNWYEPNYGHPNMLLACALARFVNNPASLERVTKVVFAGKTSDKAVDWNASLIKTILREYRDKGNVVFNGAYMVRGNDGMDKIECVVDYYIDPLRSICRLGCPKTMEATWSMIYNSYGFGSFMAGQVVADLRWAYPGMWTDRLKWAPMGPGSLRGLNRIHFRPLKSSLSQEVFLKELMELRDRAIETLLSSNAILSRLTERLEAIDWQNCLCEYDKYCRVLYGEGKPKQKYPGV